MELHPENPPETRVLLGLLAYETLKERVNEPYVVQVSNDPAPDTNMEIGLAQGGESADPGFFDNIQANGAALGPGLVRLDNIFNYYNIVQRAADGTITYHWTDFDRVLDCRASDEQRASYLPLLYAGNPVSFRLQSRRIPGQLRGMGRPGNRYGPSRKRRAKHGSTLLGGMERTQSLVVLAGLLSKLPQTV